MLDGGVADDPVALGDELGLYFDGFTPDFFFSVGDTASACLAADGDGAACGVALVPAGPVIAPEGAAGAVPACVSADGALAEDPADDELE